MFVAEFSSTIVQHNLAHQSNLESFPLMDYHHLILYTRTKHRKRLEMTQGVNSLQAGTHYPPPQSKQLWFSTSML